MIQSTCPCVRFSCWIYGITTLLLTIAAIFISKGQDVLWINSRHSGFMDSFMIWITQLGAGLLFLPFLIAMLFVRFRYAVLTVLIWAGHGIVCALLKRGLFGYLKRPRELLDNDLLYFVPNVDVHSFFSFPSGHTATMFCLALLASLIIRKRLVTILLLLIALLVAYSRIYLLEHFLMDIAGGAVVGVATTYFAWRYFQKAALPEWMNYYLRVNPNLSLKLTNQVN